MNNDDNKLGSGGGSVDYITAIGSAKVVSPIELLRVVAYGFERIELKIKALEERLFYIGCVRCQGDKK